MVSSKASWLWAAGTFGAGRDVHLEDGNRGSGSRVVDKKSENELSDSNLFMWPILSAKSRRVLHHLPLPFILLTRFCLLSISLGAQDVRRAFDT
jgi:hypothetical protein